ncbi:MAG: ATP-binding protein [Eubacteriales bacterium]|nr:ATP-binding protein [Eubacteriales bacterium]
MSETKNVQITAKRIRNSLKRYNALDSVAEYVWNGFDANASIVELTINENILQSISDIEIKDNGHGINRDELDAKFTPFFQSEKVYDPNVKHSATHGKNGVGRLTFFTFCNKSSWSTVFKKEQNNFHYNIDIDSNFLEKYEPTDIIPTQDQLGTKVSFYGIDNKELSIDSIKDFLIKEFCWFLELHKEDKYKIIINGMELDYSPIINARDTVTLFYNDNKMEFTIDFVCWNNKLNEYSKYYYIKSDGTELSKENTTLNNKGDSFYHSVYIKSILFDDFNLRTDISEGQQSFAGMKNRQSDEYIFLMREVNSFLRDKRRPFLKENVSKIIDELDIISAFPRFDQANIFDQFRKSEIESMVSSIYVAQPKIFSNLNKEQKKTFIRLLDLTMQSGEINNLFNILLEIIEMDPSEREDLSELLQFTHMSSISKTINLIKDRYQAIDGYNGLRKPNKKMA